MRKVLFVIFAVSGFSGLIYESIWTHYLKLFLGHAAYAQTLVLGIFMGGMAIGAWIAARRSQRWRNPLGAYAGCEAVLGVLALGFHPVFTAFLDFAYEHAIPSLDSTGSVFAFKWIASALLILPQSILLGMTFPLMSAGILRRFPDGPGASLATLYFTNSLGGAIGVLLSGFVLIDRLALPGTIATAGALNLMLAAVVWALAGRSRSGKLPADGRPTDAARIHGPSRNFMALMLAAALFTGLSSLIYEVGWIRMLSLVLGSSTHAFELMLSAFICGLAFGGLWIRHRIDRLHSPLFALALIQILMGVFALATLPVYGMSFDAMASLLGAIERTDRGYLLFNLGSHAIAFAVMLPATVCAGMTLPLATCALLAGGAGERSIGFVYSANTIGAIAGVAVALHFALPLLGLKNTIVAAAAIDLALGIVLMAFGGPQGRIARIATSTIIAAAAVAASLAVSLDPVKLSAGVYRTGKLPDADRWKVTAHRDGKTASIALVELPDGSVSISTNGKSEASVNLARPDRPTGDEPTMILAGAIGSLLKPHARNLAIIGFGSGLTTDMALAFPGVARVDTIEIEPGIVELARSFHPRNIRAYEDPRSHVHFDDAKSFFSTRRERFDIIVSEPSNPWVSGVAGLFSAEFYRIAARHLNPGGLLVQWLQLYEIDLGLVAVILKALDVSFEDYIVLATNHSDILVIASPRGAVPQLAPALPDLPAVVAELNRAGVRTAGDLGLRVVSSRRLLHPFLADNRIPVSSDYRPIVDQRAAKQRFLRSNTRELPQIAQNPVPVLAMLGGLDTIRDPAPATRYPHFRPSALKAVAQAFAANPDGEPARDGFPGGPPEADSMAKAAAACVNASGPNAALEAIIEVAYRVLPFISAEQAQRTAQWIGSQRCGKLERRDLALYARLLSAIGARDAQAMVSLSESILQEPGTRPDRAFWLAVGSGMVGYLALGRPEDARLLASRHQTRLEQLAQKDLAVRLTMAHAGLQQAKAAQPGKPATPEASPNR